MKEWLLQQRWRVMSVGLLLVAVPVLSLAFFVYLTMARDMERMLFASCRDQAAACVQAVTDKLHADLALGQVYARRPSMLAGLQQGDRQKLLMNLRDLVDRSGSFERAFVASPQGVLLADYPSDPKVQGQDFSHRDWYRGVSRQWSPYVSEFFQRAAQPPRFLFNIAIPIKGQGDRICGILVMQPHELYFKTPLARVEIQRVEVHILDQNGRVVYSSPQSISGLQDFSSHPLVRKLQQGLSGEEKAGSLHGQERVVAAYLPVNPWGWGVIAERPLREAMAPVTKAILSLTIFTAAVLLLGGFGAFLDANLLLSSQRLSRELQEANDKMLAHQQELARSNADLEQFAYVASHDLQEPLRIIASYLQLLERRYQGQMDAEADKFIARAVAGASRMKTLINDLLLYSRVGRQGEALVPTSCEAACKTALANLKAAVEESGAKVNCNHLPTVVADASQLTQLFQNLIGNAVKFHGEEAPRVEVSARRNGNEWVFAVRDNGIGMEAEYLDRIFGVFQRLHTRAEYPGTGIGLAICRKIVELQGGRIWAESEPQQGSTFYFTLPDQKGERP